MGFRAKALSYEARVTRTFSAVADSFCCNDAILVNGEDDRIVHVVLHVLLVLL